MFDSNGKCKATLMCNDLNVKFSDVIMNSEP